MTWRALIHSTATLTHRIHTLLYYTLLYSQPTCDAARTCLCDAQSQRAAAVSASTHVYAGAINLTYFLSGQRHGLDVYAEDLSGTRVCVHVCSWQHMCRTCTPED